MIKAASRVVLLVVQGSFPLLAQGAQQCGLDVPVYGPRGERLPFKITRVSSMARPQLNLLSQSVEGLRLQVRGSTVFFSNSALIGKGLEVEVALQGPNKERLSGRLTLPTCRTRRALNYGSAGVDDDVNGIPVEGKLTGCNFNGGDWWVMATPMFGSIHPIRLETAPGSDGSFEMLIHAAGVRYVFQIGRDAEIVRTVTANATVGQVLGLGEIDLRGLCGPR